jgi:flagellar basal body rod protein FlgG
LRSDRGNGTRIRNAGVEEKRQLGAPAGEPGGRDRGRHRVNIDGVGGTRVDNSLRQRFNNTSSVNIDEEMANLLNLQNAYAANARVMSTIKEMLDTLLKM